MTDFDVMVIGGGHAGCEAGGRGGALRRAHGAGHPSLRHHRRNVLQSGDRRARQGPSGARDRRARRVDGARRRRGRHPVPRPQPPQGPGRPGTARPGRPQALSAGDAGADRARPRISPSSKPKRPRILSEAGAVTGLALADGRALACRAVVVTTGTFLRGVIHLGEQRTPAGRFGDPAFGRAGAESRRGRLSPSPGSRPARRRGSTGRRSTGRGSRSSPATSRPSSFPR